jgi:hypothetical protein
MVSGRGLRISQKPSPVVPPGCEGQVKSSQWLSLLFMYGLDLTSSGETRWGVHRKGRYMIQCEENHTSATSQASCTPPAEQHRIVGLAGHVAGPIAGTYYYEQCICEHGRNLCAICGGATLTQISRSATRPSRRSERERRSERVGAIAASLVCHWHRSGAAPKCTIGLPPAEARGAIRADGGFAT